MFENIQRRIYQIGAQTLYLRSKWEYEYACYLEWLKIHNQIKGWKYEPKEFEFPIRHGTTRYLPDFCIYNFDGSHEWHEVKGYFTSKGKTQIKRFKKYFPKEKLIVIDGDWFKAVKNKKQLWLK
jgi:hypothetical protein